VGVLRTVPLLEWRDVSSPTGRESSGGAGRHQDRTPVARADAGFGRVVWAMPDIVLVLERQGRVVDCNGHADLIAPREEVVGRMLIELLPADLVERTMSAIEEALDSGQQVMFEYTLEVQGRSSWFEARFRSFDEDLVLQIIRNIDSEKAAQEDRARREEAIRLSEGRLSRAQAVAKVGSWEFDIATGELSWSDGIYELLEIDKRRFAATYDAFLQAIHPEDRQRIDSAYSASLVDRAPYQINHRLLMPDGRIKWVENRSVTDFAPDGTALVSLGTVRDITDEYLIGEELRQFKKTLDQTLDCVFMFDAESLRFTYVNQGAIGQLGYEQAELLQMHPYEIKPEFPEPKFRDLLAPLLTGEHDQIRFETVHRHKGGHLVPVDVFLQYVTSAEHDARFVAVVRDVADRHEFELRLEHQATHDALTGLPNRELLRDRVDHALARAARHGGSVGVLFLDLDRFKLINDTRGHGVGDQILIAVAQRLRTVVRDGDTLARHGGDEFVVLVENNTDTDGVVRLADRIRNILHDPIRVGDSWFHTTASIGTASSTDGDHDAATLLSNADAAMYQAKHAGRGRIVPFNDSLRARLQHRLETENELRTALQRDELRVHYQPIVDVASLTIKGFEALVRWQHPDRGLLAPAEFVPVAEDTGLIAAIDMWVLQAAADQVLAWDDSATKELYVAVNLSADDLVDPTIPDRIADIIGATGIDPNRIHIEVTETALIEHPAQATAALQQMSLRGTKIALDDFGTGCSSLAHIKTMPLTHIKIDRSFTEGLGINATDTAIIESTVKLAHDLGLTVVAEGVETAAQLVAVKALGCDLVQGYHLGHPQPPEQLDPRLHKECAESG
jgi:diguanylate cyclase (GGDEF)-like protein/PAS domain S-box-containing protein